MDSIIAKCEEYCSSSSFKNRGDVRSAGAVVSEKMAVEAARKFVWILQQQIASLDIPVSIKETLLSFDISIPAKRSDGTYYILIYQDKPTMRKSLYEEEYPLGILDIGLLYNYGMHAKDYVYGWAEDKFGYPTYWMRSKKDIEATHYIDEAIKIFMGMYASTYNIIDISIVQ